MNRPVHRAILLGIFLVAIAGTAEAQFAYVPSHLEINLHGGLLSFDDLITGDSEVMLGGRIIYNHSSGLSVAGNFDWTQPTLTVLAGDAGTRMAENDLLLFSAEAQYGIPVADHANVFVAAGAGAALFSPDIGDSESRLLVPIGGGIKIFNAPTNPAWAIRIEARDQIIFLTDVLSFTPVDGDPTVVLPSFSDETAHNLSISAGISILFGRSR